MYNQQAYSSQFNPLSIQLNPTKLYKKLSQAKKDDRIKINNKIFTIQQKIVEKKSSKWDSDQLCLDLGNNYCLVIEHNKLRFFQNITKKRWIFTTIHSNHEKIEKIELI